jgi:mRNA interferase YafQ
MRTIEQTGQFKRDLKREAKGSHRQALQSDFVAIVVALANDEALAEKYRDHGLTGDWKDHRDCRVDLGLQCPLISTLSTCHPERLHVRICS